MTPLAQFCTMRLLSSCRILLLSALAEGVSGKIVREELTLVWERGAPNGQPRDVIMMNGQFPGPTFVWDEDDDVEVGIREAIVTEMRQLMIILCSGHCT